ncbi:hypothetical protein Nepgr_031645 [Nepenthes gracilis]|uniref:Uncharacterized protein n=1 Tax=Nepenthes gracilis TaxID=150966 RepID=A0AAD3Y503_NEPGR|nr:hypothetical protein Nepgr_031645 [Nepenthes gracilis]
MHRQSLGSPGSRLHIHGGASQDGVFFRSDEQKGRDSLSSLSSPITVAGVADEIKFQKPHRSCSGPQRFIHLIPVLSLLCFFILYLFSHEPSETDLTDTGDLGRLLHKRERLAIRSMWNLHEIAKDNPKSRPHRKLGDF